MLELFAGIGACSKALENLKVKYRIVDAVEIDKYAIKSFNAIHNTNFEVQDITKWDKEIDVDLIMHGSPCQDFSIAGKQKGGDQGSGTRSSLMYETLRIVEKLKPQFVIWENVKNVLSKKHIHNFENYINTMNQLGYTSFYKILNARDYGIPQNRERVFTISIKNYEFPKKQKLNVKLKDVLEKEVDKKYYLNKEQIEKIKATIPKQKEIIDMEIADFRYDKGIRIRKNEIAPCLTTKTGSASLSSNVLLIKNATKKGYLEAEDGDGIYTNTSTKRGTVQKQMIPTITTFQDKGVILENLKIRKLTPKECFRLMGFDDDDFEKAAKVNSNNQLCKQAGNTIVVKVLEKILEKLLL